MRFYVNGFSWEASKPLLCGPPMASRAEALAALDALSSLALTTKYGGEARAAYSVADFSHCLSCCEAAEEKASPERWR